MKQKQHSFLSALGFGFLFTAFLLACSCANATQRHPMQPSPSAINVPIGVGIGVGQGGNATGGIGNGGSVDVDNPRQFPILPPAIAPSQSINNDCQIATPQSNAVSFLFIVSASQTTGVEYNDICYAYKRGQFDVADQMMCEKSESYRKANPDCEKP